MDRSVGSKERVEIAVGESMRMRAFLRQDHEVGDIYDADAKIRDEFP